MCKVVTQTKTSTNEPREELGMKGITCSFVQEKRKEIMDVMHVEANVWIKKCRVNREEGICQKKRAEEDIGRSSEVLFGEGEPHDGQKKKTNEMLCN